MNKFSKKLSEKSESQLKEIILNEKVYTSELVLGAIHELEKREHELEGLEDIKQRLEKSVNEEVVSIKEPFIPKGIPLTYVIAAVLIYLNAISFFILSNFELRLGAHSYSMSGGITGLLLVLIILIGVVVHGGRVAGVYLVSLVILFHTYNYFFSEGTFFNNSRLTIFLALPYIGALFLLLLPVSLKWYKSQKGEQVEEEEFIFPD